VRCTLITTVNESRARLTDIKPWTRSSLRRLRIAHPTVPRHNSLSMSGGKSARSRVRLSILPSGMPKKRMTQSLLDADFDLKRHQIADVAVRFGLSHRRSRELCDQTILAIRRLFWDEIRPKLIGASELRRTGGRPLAKYAPFLSPTEFVKLIYLLRNLTPIVVLDAKPENARAIQAGDWEATRENLQLRLRGIRKPDRCSQLPPLQ
jgi:hypothetical protein